MIEEATLAMPDKRKPMNDLLLVLFLAALGAAGAFLLPGGDGLRAALGLPLLILFPGYAMVSVLWPENNKDGKGIDLLERIALSVGLSIAIVSVMGLVLSLTVGLTLAAVLAGNVAFLIACTMLAQFRRNRLPPEKRFSLEAFHGSLPHFSRTSECAFSVLIIAGIVICSGFVTYSIVNQSTPEPYSRLYILDANRTTHDYPVNITANETATVFMGLVNNERTMTNYTILVRCENYTQPVFVGDWDDAYPFTNTTYLARNVTLADDAVFEEPLSFYFPEPGEYRVSWQLLLEGRATEYSVHLWIRVNP